MFLLIWTICYLSVLVGLSAYGVHRYFIIYLFLKNRKRKPAPAGRFEKLPVVTVRLATAKGEFVCILDADFVPPPHLLRKTVDFFTDPKVGMIQTRWGHLNRGYSLLTRVQAMFLDGHLVLEQTARSRSGRFFNFNGT